MYGAGSNVITDESVYFVPSGKKAEEIPADVWELGVQTQVTDVNFSKNQLKQWPSK